MIKKQIKDSEKDFLNIFQRLKNRDFSGNTGLAIKNSAYQFSSNIVTRIGSFLFIIIVARLLMPDLFGLYNLALSTIMIFYVFSDLGTNQSLIYFLSPKFGKKQYGKAKGYIRTLFILKVSLTILSVLALLLLANFISEVYYQKPLFLALLAGAIYIFLSSIQSFLASLFYSQNNFKIALNKDIIFQSLRIILVPLAVFVFIKILHLSDALVLFYIILLVSLIYLVSVTYLFLKAKKTFDFKNRIIKTSKKENKIIIKSVLGFSILSFSLILFGNIDKIILGYFVSTEYIGYYSAAFNIITSLVPLIIFSDSLFPIFLRMKKDKAEAAFKKSLRFVLLLSFFAFLFIFIFANNIISIIFGSQYLAAIPLLRFSSLLLLTFPASEIFSSYLISRGYLSKISKFILFALVLTIFLTFMIPYLLLNQGFYAATLGVIFAMVIGKIFYLAGLIFIWKKDLKIKEV